MSGGRTLISSSHKKYALVPSSTKTLLTRDELRSISRLVDTTSVSSKINAEHHHPARSIPPLPFERVYDKGDTNLNLTVSPIHPKESAIDAPLRFVVPEEYHAPAFDDPPSYLPLARRVAALLKGAESAPMTWLRKAPSHEEDVATTHVKALKDAETRACAALRAGEKERAARLLCLMGTLHYNYGNVELAIKAFGRALTAFEATQSEKGVAYCHNIIGVCHFRLREFKMSLVHHKKQEALGGAYAKAVGQINMGVNYAALRELEFAAQAFEDALASSRECEDDMLETIALGNMGLISLRVGNMRSAQTHLEQCLEKCSVAGDKSGAALCLLLLGEVYSHINDHQHALFYYEHAYRVGGEATNADIVDIARVSIGIARGNAAIKDVILSQATLMGQTNDVQSIVNLLPL